MSKKFTNPQNDLQWFKFIEATRKYRKFKTNYGCYGSITNTWFDYNPSDGTFSCQLNIYKCDSESEHYQTFVLTKITEKERTYIDNKKSIEKTYCVHK